MNSKYRSWRWFAALVVLGLLVAACGGNGESTTTTGDGVTTTAGDPGDGTTTPTTPEVEADPGLDGCLDRPNTCNAGPVADGGDMIFMINQTWTSWHTGRPEGGSVYLFQALEGLQATIGQFTPDGEWTWDMDTLAEEPQITSEDPLTIQYVISEDAVWYNGDGTTTPITGDDFLIEWYQASGNPEHCLHEEQLDDDGNPVLDDDGEIVMVNLCSPRATARTEDIQAIDVSDDGKTVTVIFPSDYAYPEWFALFGSLQYPAHIAMNEGHDWTTPEGMAGASDFFNTTPIYWSGGPYLLEDHSEGQRMVMVPNPEWYGDPVALDTVTKILNDDQGGWLTALTNRDFHGGAPASFPVDLVIQLEGTQGVHHAVGTGGAVWDHVDVNMDHPALGADVVLRQAIFTALDREDARQSIFGGVIDPTFRNNPIFTQTSPFFEDVVEVRGYGTGDVDAARAMLEAAGYTGMDGGPGALTTPDGDPVGTIRFSWVEGNTNRASFVELSQNYLGDIGIDVQPYPSSDLGTTLATQDYDLVIFGWSGSPLFTSSANQFYNSASGSNFGRFSNAEVDRLVQEVLNQNDLADSARLANEAVHIVSEEAYTLPLWDTMNLMFVVEEVANVRDNHFNSLRSFYNLGQWGFLAN